MNVSDYLGGRGEAIAFARLSKICRPDVDLPYFWPRFLGDKCETYDFLVELVDAGERTPFFFVQVKATRKPYLGPPAKRRLRVEVSEKDVRRMAACPAPTYVVGVHEAEERAFVVAVHGTMSLGISSVTTAYELTAENLQRLWDEVREHWRGYEATSKTSSFQN